MTLNDAVKALAEIDKANDRYLTYGMIDAVRSDPDGAAAGAPDPRLSYGRSSFIQISVE